MADIPKKQRNNSDIIFDDWDYPIIDWDISGLDWGDIPTKNWDLSLYGWDIKNSTGSAQNQPAKYKNSQITDE